jgi:prevent-host-death family protein
MDSAKRYRPLAYLKTNAEDVAKELTEEAGPVIITVDGAPSFACISLEEYYQMQETNALVKLINLGQREIKSGRYESLADARASLDEIILKGKVADQG